MASIRPEGEFWHGDGFAKVPAMLNEFYLTMPFVYASINLTEKACEEKETKKKPGFLFVVGWGALASTMILLVSFNLYGEEEDLDLFWPDPFLGVLLIYAGSQILKKTNVLLEKLKAIYRPSAKS